MVDGKKKQGAVATGEPLPIWFFVGVILLVYGLLVLAAYFMAAPRETVLASTKPSLWWGTIIVVAGGILLGIGLKARQQ
jgi:hypothetical protein